MGYDKLSWCYLIVFLSITDLSSALKLSKTSAIREVDKPFLVACQDNNNGKGVTWKGPDGKTLNENTHPRLQVKSYGYTLFFDKIQTGDAGIYTCVSLSSKEEAQFTLKVGDDSYEKVHGIATYFGNSASEDGGGEVGGDDGGVESRGEHSEGTEENRFDTVSDTTSHTSYFPINYPTVHTDIVNGEHLQFIRTPSEKRIPEGTSDTIPCEALGGDVTWLVNQTEPTGEKYEKGGDGLIIKNVTKEDEYNEYVCRIVSQSLATLLDKKIKLVVLRKPRFPENFEKEVIVYGIKKQHINLTCEVDSEPPAKINWHYKSKGDRVVQEIVENVTSGARSILHLYMNDAAPDKYICFAENEFGKLKAHYDVRFGMKPDPPKSFEILDILGDGMTLEIIPPDDNPELTELFKPTGFQVQYRVFENETETNKKSSKRSKRDGILHGWFCCWQNFDFTEDNTYTLTGLDPTTPYEIQVATKNIAGTSDFLNSTVIQTVSGASQRAVNYWASAFVLSISTIFLGNGWPYLVPFL